MHSEQARAQRTLVYVGAFLMNAAWTALLVYGLVSDRPLSQIVLRALVLLAGLAFSWWLIRRVRRRA